MKKLISLLLVLTMILTACSGGTAPGPAEEPKTPEGPKEDVTEGGKYAAEQVYKYTYAEEITTLNYLINTTWVDMSVAANLVDTLAQYDKYGVLQPALAEKWEVTDDGLEWTFHLKKGIKWVDFEGNEVAETTANDFVASAKYILTKANESESANIVYSVIKNAEEYFNEEITDFTQVGVKAADDYTLVYTLKEPVPYFESMLTYVSFFPVYEPFLEEMGDLFGTANSAILYNGAYLLTEFEPQIKRLLTKNEAYWDKDAIFVKELNYKYNKEASSLGGELFRRGEVSHAVIPTTNLDEWMTNPELKDKISPDRLGTYTFFYAFNFNPKFDAQYEPENWKIAVNNVNFRRSIVAALNRRAAVATEDPYNPDYRVLNTITPPNFTSQNGLDYTDIGDLAALKGKDFYNEAEAKALKEKAVEELTKAGAKFPVKILMPYNTNSSYWAQEAQVVKQGLETILGSDYVQVTLLPHAPTGFLDGTRRAGNYSLMQVNWGPDYADPQTYTDPFRRGGNYNFPDQATELNADGKNIYDVYGDMIQEAKAELIDLTKRYELFANAEAYLINNAFVIPLKVSAGDGYVASVILPFERPYAPFGIATMTWKGARLLSAPISMAEFEKAQQQWQAERDNALKEAAK